MKFRSDIEFSQLEHGPKARMERRSRSRNQSIAGKRIRDLYDEDCNVLAIEKGEKSLPREFSADVIGNVGRIRVCRAA